MKRSLLEKAKNKFILWLIDAWNRKNSILVLLIPFSKIYQYIICKRYSKRKSTLRPGNKRSPIIVVGNLIVGGSGKTPCVMAIARLLQENGYHPGIVTRGYGGETHYPCAVLANTSAKMVGDEAVLMSRELALPVVVDPDRNRAVDYLLKNYAEVNVVISDDGLQHLNLARDIEIVIVDAVRKFGNGRCLPAGPMREPIERLGTVDLIIAQGLDPDYQAYFKLELGDLIQLNNPQERISVASLVGTTVHAVAAIGNPERFFNTLTSLGLKVIAHPLPDHAWIMAEDLTYDDNFPVIMTAKDAVKCQEIANFNCYYLQVKPVFNETAKKELLCLITQYK